MKKKVTELLIYIVLAEIVGAFSALIAGNTKVFYDSLNKPPLSPPSVLFPIMWVTLYALMAIAAFLISQTPSVDSDRNKKHALIIYYAQLIVNALWSFVFFRLKMLSASVAVIIVLLALIIYMTWRFYKIRPATIYFLVPYILWVAFATYLNIGVMNMN